MRSLLSRKLKSKQHLLIIGLAAILLITLFALNTSIFTFKNSAFERGETPQESLSEEPKYAPNQVIVKLKKQLSIPLSSSQAKNSNYLYTDGLVLKDIDKKTLHLDPRLAEFENIGVSKIQPLKQSRVTRNISSIDNIFLLTIDSNKVQERIMHKVQGKNIIEYFASGTQLQESDLIQTVVYELEQRSDVEYAVPNYYGKLFLTRPNDKFFPKPSNAYNQLHLYNIQNLSKDLWFTLAWDIIKGSSDTVIAVVDTGIDYDHEDLHDRIWQNDADIPGDGIDNDNNGFIDDHQGWDFANADNDPMDDFGHGTHVAGIAGASTNNSIGVAGVDWNAQIMNVKLFDENGQATLDQAVSAMLYSIDSGAHIINTSWGFPMNQALKDVAAYAESQNVLIVSSAGNDGVPNVAQYAPAGIESVVSVGSVDQDLTLSDFSSYGSLLDLVAPGRSIFSTFMPGKTISQGCADTNGDGYDYCSGTSMAAPIVSGVAGLIRATGITDVHELKRRLVYTAKDLGPMGKDREYGFGVVYPVSAVDSSVSISVGNINNIDKYKYFDPSKPIEVRGTALADGFSHYTLTIGQGESPNSWNSNGILLANGGFQEVESGSLATLDISNLSEGFWSIKLTVTKTDNTSFTYQTLLWKRGQLTLYVDQKSTSPTEDGTQAHPYKTISAALDQGYENVKVLVKNGNYQESVRIAQSDVELIGESKENTIIRNYCMWYECPTIDIQSWDPSEDVKNILVKNFTIPIQGLGTGILISGPTENITVEHTNIVQNDPDFCVRNGCEDVGIDVLYLATNIVLRNNTINGFMYNMWIRGPFLRGIYVYDNYLAHGRWAGVQPGDLLGGGNLEIKGNIFLSNKINAIGLFGFPNTVISDNYFINNGTGIFIAWMDNGVANIYQNRFLYNNSYVGESITLSDALINFKSPNEEIGNYWSEFDTPIEGAVDLDKDGIFDSEHTFGDFGGTNKETRASANSNNPSKKQLSVRPSAFNVFPNGQVTLSSDDALNYTSVKLRRPYSQTTVALSFSKLSANSGYFNIPSTLSSGLYTIDLVKSGQADYQTETYIAVFSQSDSSAIQPPSPTPSPTVPPDFGQAIKFDRINSELLKNYGTLAVKETALTNIGKEFTLDFWLKLNPADEPQGDYGYGLVSPISKEYINGFSGYIFDITKSPEYWGDYLIPATTVRFPPDNTPLGGFINREFIPGEWYFVRMVRKDAMLAVYINGTISSEWVVDNDVFQYDSSRFLIGCSWIKDFPICAGPFVGEIDEIRISHTARDGAEVPNGPMPIDDMTAALYRFDGDTADATPNQLNGEVIGNIEYSNRSYVRSTVGTKPIIISPSSTFTPTPQACIPQLEICDGLDNDCDGQYDEGNVCSISPTGEKSKEICPNNKLGKALCDTDKPSLKDYLCWRYELVNKGKKTTIDGVLCKQADFNGDNKVNLFDFVIWRSNFVNKNIQIVSPTKPPYLNE